MKTKIFFAFIIVIVVSLLSNFIFRWLITRDFDSYVSGVREDQFYWILASVEGSYSDGKWNKALLSEPIHWAMMLGLDVKVLNTEGQEVTSSKEVINSLSDTMRHRMERLFHIHETEGKYEEYPLYIKGKRIGTLLSRPFQKETLMEKELIFKRRTKNFLFVSFLIAGGGSLLIALLLSQYLTKPIARLKAAAEKISKGDFTVRTTVSSKDEVGKLSESFNIMAESLQKEEELRKHLMSNIAHELRTPLTILKTHVEGIMDGVVDREKGLENIKDGVQRLTMLVKGIEDITMAEASFFVKADTTEINLREFLSGLVSEMLLAFKEKGLDLTVVSETTRTENKDDLFVITDVEKLEKIMRNLLSNSLKFTEKGGAWIKYGIDGKMFFIEIKDSGKGIPEKEIPLIFNRFYRIENQIPLKPLGGLGLGLAIVKELTEVMGGSVKIKSEVNRGTTFTLYFPLRG